MKICDLTQSYTDTSGGVRTYIDEKRKYIERHTDCEHVLIIPGEKDAVNENGRLVTHTVASPHIPGCEPYRVVLRLGHVVSILEEERPDIIELGCAYTLPWAAFRHRRENPCKVTGFYHTDFPHSYVEKTVNDIFGETIAKRARMIASQYVRFLYNRFDRVFTASCSLQKNLSKYGIKKVEYTPLGVDTDMFNPSRRSPKIREALGITDTDLMLVYAGRLDIEKRIHVLTGAIEIVSGIIPARIVIAGDGPLSEQLQNRYVHDSRIVILPYMSDKAELATLLASGDIYVTAGPHETFGLSVLEAQACGLPVVGVRAGALTERVRPSFGLLGKPDNVEQFAKNIVTLSKTGFREMGMKAREHVESTYSWKKTFNRIFNHYNTLFS